MKPISNDKPDESLGVVSRTMIAICLIVTAIEALAIARSIQDSLQATADARLLRRAPSITWSAGGYADAGPSDFLEVDWGPPHAR